MAGDAAPSPRRKDRPVAPALPDREAGWPDWLPPRLRDYALLMRLDRPIGVWLLLLPCWWGMLLAPGQGSLRLAALFAVGAVTMRGAGCVVNDLIDRDLDRRVSRTRHRPLAAGRVGIAEALGLAAVLALAGLVVLLQLPRPAILVGLGSVPLVLLYPLAKRVTWWPQAALGVTFNWGVLVGYAVINGKLGAAAILLWLAGVAWTLGYDTIYALLDRAQDGAAGIRSTARRLGEAVKGWLWGFYGCMLLLLVAAGAAIGQGTLFWLTLPLVAWALAHQLVTLDPNDEDRCLRAFRGNREVGLLVALALLLGGLPS